MPLSQEVRNFHVSKANCFIEFVTTLHWTKFLSVV